jgi:hypothetical protein
MDQRKLNFLLITRVSLKTHNKQGKFVNCL